MPLPLIHVIYGGFVRVIPTKLYDDNEICTCSKCMYRKVNLIELLQESHPLQTFFVFSVMRKFKLVSIHLLALAKWIFIAVDLVKEVIATHTTTHFVRTWIYTLLAYTNLKWIHHTEKWMKIILCECECLTFEWDGRHIYFTALCMHNKVKY